MGVNLLLPIEDLQKVDQVGTFSHFDSYVSGDEFTLVATDSGTAAVGDAAGGILTISASDVTEADNDEAYIKGSYEIFKFAANKPLVFEARVKGVSDTIAETNYIVGIKDAVAANTLQDNGAGPAASYSGAVFFAVDGGSYWVCESSIGASQTTVTTTTSFAGGVYQKLRIEFRPLTSTVGEVHFFIDGVEVGLNNGVAHRVSFASATEMQICLGVKAGKADTQTLLVDYVGCWQAV